MNYLNQESQFTRISDAHARQLMESVGYEMPAATQTISEVYLSEGRRFALLSEVVEAEDGLLYVQLEEVHAAHVIQVDESGRETLVESITYEDVEFFLEGLYEDGEGGLFACMVCESAEESDEDAEESDEDEE